MPSSPALLHGLGAGAPPSIAVVKGTARECSMATRDMQGEAHGVVPRQRPALIWSRDVGGPVEAQAVVSPDEKVFYAASLGGNLYSLVARRRREFSGPSRWAIGPTQHRHVAGDGTIYAGSDAHKLFAVSPQGKVQWSLETEGEADTAPAMAKDGTVVFAAGSMVYGVGPVGYVRWRYAAKRKVYSSVAIAENDRIFFGSQDHHAYALSSDGKLLWTVDLGADVDGAPALDDGGNVYFGTDAMDVVRLNPDDGRVLWRAHTGGYVRGPVSITRDGDVLAGVYGPAPREVRLSASDGSLRGDFPIQGTGAREFGVHGGAVEDDRGRCFSAPRTTVPLVRRRRVG